MLATPPKAARKPTVVTHHGHSRIDPYAWLRDPNWQQVMRAPSVLDKGIRAYLEAENFYTAEALAPTEGLQETLFGEMKGRIKEDDSSVPALDGDYLYYHRYNIGSQHPIYCRRPKEEIGGIEQILLNGNHESKGKAFFRISSCEHAPNHKLLAWSADLSGSEFYTIRVRDLMTGKDLTDVIEMTEGGIVWANDGQTFFYTVYNDQHRPWRIYRHRIGDSPTDDALVYEEEDPGFFLCLDQTESRKYILIAAHDHTTSEVHTIDADAPDTAPILIAARERDIEYDVSHQGDRFLFRTNANGAEDFKIACAPVATPGRNNWQDLVTHQPGCLLLTMLVFADWLVRLERIDGLPRIVVQRLTDGSEHSLAFEEEAYALRLSSSYEFNTKTLRFTYSSLTTPERVYDDNMASHDRLLRKEDEVPSGHDPAAYIDRRILVRSHDGEEVPVSILHARSTPIDGSAPLLLYGYGSYGISIPASFAASRFSLVDRGFVYAIAHIRGGTDRGYRWYRDGKKLEKINTFLDYAAVADALIAANYTAAGNIAGHGGSAGGMLMGWIANERPELFKAIVADVPFVDVLNTMLDDTLPLTPPEWQEWGNPITDKEAYDNILSYSPYDNVRAQSYPHILALAGLTDPRVTYWEPAKWAARLREMKRDGNLLLLKTNMAAGHAGAAGRFDRLRETALIYAFILKVFDKA